MTLRNIFLGHLSDTVWEVWSVTAAEIGEEGKDFPTQWRFPV